MAIDPRSIIGEILSRRPDLRKAFASAVERRRQQIAGLGTSGLGGPSSPYGTFEETRGIARSPQAFAGSPVTDAADLLIPPSQKPFSSGLARQRLDAAIRTRNAPPASGPIPPNMGNMSGYTPGEKDLFTGGEFTPEELGVLVPRDGPQPPLPGAGQAPSDLQPFSPPGSWGALRERQAQLPGERDIRMNPRPLPGAGQPPSDLQPFTPSSLAGLGPAFGGPDNPQIASLLAPGGIAPGAGQPQGPPLMPGGPPRIPQPRPDFGVPQARPPQPYDIGGRPSTVPPAQFADLPNGPRDLTPGIRAYSGQEARLPRLRPDIPQAPTSPPISPDQRIADAPGAGPPPPIDPSIAAHAQRAALGARPAPTQGGFQPAPGFDQALSLNQPPVPPVPPAASAAVPGFDPAASPFVRPTEQNLGIGIPKYALGTTEMNPIPETPNPFIPGQQISGARSPGFNLMGMQQEQRVRQRGPLVLDMTPPAETAPLGAVPPVQQPPPGASSSLTPQQIQRTMGTQALYNQPPPGMVLPPGVTQQDVGRLSFGATNIDPSKAPVQRTGSGTGKIAGTVIGGLKGLASGGPLGALVGGYLGNRAGKRVGGLLGDRDFGLGARFSNPNYPQGVVANPPAIMDMGVPAITPPVDIPVTEAQGGIFGTAKRAVGALRGLPRDLAAMVKDGRLSLAEAKSMIGSSGSTGSSVSGGNWGSSGGRGGQYGGGFGGGGGYGGGGTYGGSGGAGIGSGIGGAFRNR